MMRTSCEKSILSLSIILTLQACTLSTLQKPLVKKQHSACDRVESDIDRRHLIIAARVQAKKLIGYCFDNYLQFEENKNKNISTCTNLKIRRSGTVSYVRATGNNGSAIPKDMKMCIEQELRIANFRKLKLQKNESINIAINFRSE